MLDSILADRDMTVDIVKNGTMLIVARLLAGGNLTDNVWEMSIVYVLIGFAFFHILIKRLIPSNLVHNKAIKRSIRTVSKFGTMFIVSRILSGQKMDMDWLKSVFFVLVGYVFYDVVTHKLVNTDGIANYQVKSVIDDAAQMVTVAFVSRLLERKSFNDKQWLMSVLFTIVGFSVYNVGISNLI